MKLYACGRGNKVVSLEVIKETPKGYKVDPTSLLPFDKYWYIPKFIKKSNERWNPSRIIVMQHYREILKRCIVSIDEDMAKVQIRKVERIAELKAFDDFYLIVNSDDKCEESFWMEQHRLGKV